jgi:hypothetical protein
MAAVMERIPPRIRIGAVAVLERYVDWSVIVADIRAAYGEQFCSVGTVAELANMPPSTLQSLLDRGGDTLYSRGEALLQLHRRACSEEKTQLRLREFRERATKSAS